MSRVYYCSSGSEANEKGYKMVRQIAHKRFGGKKHKILYRDRDYHGSTIGAMACGGQDERNAQYGPFPDGFIRVPHCLEYRKHEQDGAPEDNYGVWAANQIEKVILREGPETVGALCLGTCDSRRRRHHPTRRLLGAYPRNLRSIRNPTAHRRSCLWRRPHRHMVRLSALRHQARHGDNGQRCCIWLCGDLLPRHHRSRF